MAGFLNSFQDLGCVVQQDPELNLERKTISFSQAHFGKLQIEKSELVFKFLLLSEETFIVRTLGTIY